MNTIWLFRYDDGQPFAFSSDGEKTWFTQDGLAWAWAGGNGWLWSYDSGDALGWFSGNTFWSIDGEPLYFKTD